MCGRCPSQSSPDREYALSARYAAIGIDFGVAAIRSIASRDSHFNDS